LSEYKRGYFSRGFYSQMLCVDSGGYEKFNRTPRRTRIVRIDTPPVPQASPQSGNTPPFISATCAERGNRQDRFACNSLALVDVLLRAITVLLLSVLTTPVFAEPVGTTDGKPPLVATTPATDQASSDELMKRGKALRKAIEDTYKQMIASKALPPANGLGKDISPVIEKYIPAGTTFDDAKQILLGAECHVVADPPRPARPEDPQYDRFSIIASAKLFRWSYGSTALSITLYPKDPGAAHTTVKRVRGSISIKAL
jgi:hypothetical protein